MCLNYQLNYLNVNLIFIQIKAKEPQWRDRRAACGSGASGCRPLGLRVCSALSEKVEDQRGFGWAGITSPWLLCFCSLWFSEHKDFFLFFILYISVFYLFARSQWLLLDSLITTCIILFWLPFIHLHIEKLIKQIWNFSFTFQIECLLFVL